MSTGFIAQGLTGGTSADLDFIDGADITVGDIGFVTYLGNMYLYTVDESGGAESSPAKITPDANAGSKRWVLQGQLSLSTTTTTVDTVNIEVTNIKAKDGTTSATIVDSTGVMTIASSVLTTADINGGTVDNVIIGGTTKAAGGFTALTTTALAAHTSAAESWMGPSSTTGVYFKDASLGIGTADPTGGGVSSKFRVKQAADTGFSGLGIETAASTRELFFFGNTGTRAVLGQTYVGGGGAYQPICVDTSGQERTRVDVNGNFLVNTTDSDGTPAVGRLTVKGSTNDGSTNIFVGRDSDEANVITVDTNGDLTVAGLSASGNVSVGSGGNYNITANGTTTRYFALLDSTETYAGKMVMQAGGGSANFGGAINLYGHSHAVTPGDVVACISSGSGGRFRVNNQGLDGGSDYLVSSSTGLAVTGTITSTGTVRLKNYTVATLPAGTQGDTAFVTDALAPSFLAVIVGGGAVVSPVFYNGTNWVGY